MEKHKLQLNQTPRPTVYGNCEGSEYTEKTLLSHCQLSNQHNTNISLTDVVLVKLKYI